MVLDEAINIVEHCLPKKYPCLLWEAWESIKAHATSNKGSANDSAAVRLRDWLIFREQNGPNPPTDWREAFTQPPSPSGHKTTSTGIASSTQICPECGGSGRGMTEAFHRVACHKCNGTGKLRVL